MLPSPAQVRQVIALSDERDLWRKLADQAFRRGFSAGREQGFTEGYAQSEADYAADWRRLTGPLAHPERYAAQRLQNALAFSKREADEHERSFVARAYATHQRDRTPVQAACVLSYPPPSRGP